MPGFSEGELDRCREEFREHCIERANPAIGLAYRRGTDLLSLCVGDIRVGELCRRLGERGSRPYQCGCENTIAD